MTFLLLPCQPVSTGIPTAAVIFLELLTVSSIAGMAAGNAAGQGQEKGEAQT